MKKITKCMLFAFALLVGFTVKANAVSAATLHQENTSYYYDRFYADGSEHSWYFKHYTMDNEVAYCIEPGVHEGTTYPQTNYEATGLPDSIKDFFLSSIVFLLILYASLMASIMSVLSKKLLFDMANNNFNTLFVILS